MPWIPRDAVSIFMIGAITIMALMLIVGCIRWVWQKTRHVPANQKVSYSIDVSVGRAISIKFDDDFYEDSFCANIFLTESPTAEDMLNVSVLGEQRTYNFFVRVGSDRYLNLYLLCEILMAKDIEIGNEYYHPRVNSDLYYLGELFYASTITESENYDFFTSKFAQELINKHHEINLILKDKAFDYEKRKEERIRKAAAKADNDIPAFVRTPQPYAELGNEVE